MSDAHLKNTIEKAIAASISVYSAEIAVTTDRGLVTIYGSVGTFAERDAAEHIAAAVSGARAIVQKLMVRRSPRPEQDSALARTALDAFHRTDERRYRNVKIHVDSGALRLTGLVGSNDDRYAVKRLLKSLPAVTNLIDDLKVGEPEYEPAATTIWAHPPGFHVEGLLYRTASGNFADTVLRAEDAIAAAQAQLVAKIDHSLAADGAGLKLRPTILLVFGNPAAGTHMMHEHASSAIDLPMKLLIVEADDGTVWIAAQDPQWIFARHGGGPHLSNIIQKMTMMIGRILEAAAGEVSASPP